MRIYQAYQGVVLYDLFASFHTTIWSSLLGGPSQLGIGVGPKSRCSQHLQLYCASTGQV